MSGYSNEYKQWIVSDKWRVKSKFCQGLTRNRCILFPWLSSRHTHHMTYRNMKNEIPMRDTVPLSVTAHKIIHAAVLWKNKKVRPFVNWVLRFCMVISIIFWHTLGRLMKPVSKRKKVTVLK